MNISVNLPVNLPIYLKIVKILPLYLIRKKDKITQHILDILAQAKEPLETREIEQSLAHVTRIKILYRLNLLRGNAEIKGKPVGSGKGAWIWWKAGVFEK